MKRCLFTIMLSAATFITQAQAPFNTIEYVDINKIKASVALHGDLWWQPDSQKAACEFPKGSGKHANFISALWMGGIDGMGQMHMAAQTYRTHFSSPTPLIDLWPGPIEGGTYADAEKWARIWKVNFVEIGNHKAQATRTIANTPAAILEWPAKNNPHAKGNNGAALTITTDMAPFIDVDNDGSYNALKGDYPDIKGDQMLWWVFNDAHLHTSTTTQSINVMMRAKAYAYARNNDLDNIIYYEYDITNTSSVSYQGFRCGIWNDGDLGFYNNDYIGFDSSHRMAVVYNRDSPDGTMPSAYGKAVPVTGVTLLEVPGDNGSTYVPAGSFIYFNNDNSIIGNPTTGTHYYNYMRAMLRNGDHYKNDFVGPGVNTKGYGTGPDVNYVFPGDPSDPAQWSECKSDNPPHDARYVLSTGDFDFNAGSTKKFSFALVIADTSANNVCGKLSFTGIKKLADTARHYYRNQPTSKLAVNDIGKRASLKIYPNPAKESIYIDQSAETMFELSIIDVTGKSVTPGYSIENKKIKISTYSLAPAPYLLIYKTAEGSKSAVFVKE